MASWLLGNRDESFVIGCQDNRPFLLHSINSPRRAPNPRLRTHLMARARSSCTLEAKCNAKHQAARCIAKLRPGALQNSDQQRAAPFLGRRRVHGLGGPLAVLQPPSIGALLSARAGHRRPCLQVQCEHQTAKCIAKLRPGAVQHIMEPKWLWGGVVCSVFCALCSNDMCACVLHVPCAFCCVCVLRALCALCVML